MRPLPSILFLAASLAAFAHAQGLPRGETGVRDTGDYLARMDTDRDGRVSLAEYQDWLTYAFDAMDRNRDGVLAGDELPGGKGKPVARTRHRERLATTFHRQDRDRDGYLTVRELGAPPR